MPKHHGAHDGVVERYEHASNDVGQRYLDQKQCGYHGRGHEQVEHANEWVGLKQHDDEACDVHHQ
jgi:hypothetical protein